MIYKENDIVTTSVLSYPGTITFRMNPVDEVAYKERLMESLKWVVEEFGEESIIAPVWDS